MTEEEWLISNDAHKMLDHIWYERYDSSNRKSRLFASACARRVWNLLDDVRSKEAIEAAEQYADGKIDPDRLRLCSRAALIPYEKIGEWSGMEDMNTYCAAKPGYAAKAAYFTATLQEDLAYPAYDCAFKSSLAVLNALPKDIENWRANELEHVLLFRDIFGNPFRPITLDSSWLSSNVAEIARTIYEERAFDKMPILADALQDAGCDSEEILDHCRGEGPHVRGCWVVDLLLGKD